MSGLRLVSIAHPALDWQLGSKRLSLLAGMEVTLLAPEEAHPASRAGLVRTISLPVQGRGANARYRSLHAALALLDPDVVHVQAGPGSALAAQVCGRAGIGIVLEPGAWAASGCVRIRNFVSARRCRRTLARADAVVAASIEALGAARRLGFRGVGVVAGTGHEPAILPARAEARFALQLAADLPVFGWAGPPDMKSGLIDALEAAALCEQELVLLIQAAGAAASDILDRADALEILHRVRLVAPEPAGMGLGDLAGFPGMLGALDALIVAPTNCGAGGFGYERSIALAQTHGVPVVHADLPGLAELVGPGGWPVPAEDPALLSRTLAAIAADPALLRATGLAAVAHARQRHSPEAAMAELAVAVGAANLARRQPRPRAAPQSVPDYLAEREPSRT